jgi:signal transduction histidine kinase
MRVSIISVFLLTFTLFVGGIVYRVDGLIFTDRISWNEAGSRSQLAPTLQALEFELSGLAQNLTSALPGVLSAQRDFSKSSSIGNLLMAASMATSDYRTWRFEKVAFAEGSAVRSWAENYIKILLTNADARNMKPGQMMIYSLLDPKGKPYIWILQQLSREQAAQSRMNFVGSLVGPDYFQKIVDRNRGQISQVFFVNSLGFALAHTTPEYMGKLLSEHPIVGEIIKNQLASGSGVFDDLQSQRVQGVYEQLANSNLYVVISTSTADLFKSRSDIRLQLIFLGLGLAFLGIAIFVILYRGEANASNAPKSAAPTTVATIAASPGGAGQPYDDGSKERTSSMIRVASALAHKLNGPNAGILGAIKLLRMQPDSTAQIDSIEAHARKTREILRTLLTFAGEAVTKYEKENLSKLMERVLHTLEPKFFRKGIHVKKEFEIVPEFELPIELLTKAFECVLNNAIEAMERAAKKDLRVAIRSIKESVEIQIQDSGDGIDLTNIEKVFDPFYTTKKGHAGLGLTMTTGIIREIAGTLLITSDKASGTTVRIVINPEKCALTAMENKQANTGFKKPESIVAPTAPRIELKGNLDLPKVPEEDVPSEMPPIPNEIIQLDNPEVDSMLEGTYENLGEKTSLNQVIQELQAVAATAPVPPIEISESKRVSADVGPFTAKIDSPDFKIQRNISKVDQMGFTIRKPGARP